MISFLLPDGMGYSPYSPAMTPWTLTLWRGDYTKMMQQLKDPGSGFVLKNLKYF
jgi:hypothetical protein